MTAVIGVLGHAVHCVGGGEQIAVRVISHDDSIAQLVGTGKQISQFVVDIGDGGVILLGDPNEPAQGVVAVLCVEAQGVRLAGLPVHGVIYSGDDKPHGRGLGGQVSVLVIRITGGIA